MWVTLHRVTEQVKTWVENWILFWSKLLLLSGSAMSDSLRPHGLQHTRIPHSSPFPGVCSSSCPLSQWYCPTISSSVAPFSSCLQSLQASGFFPSESVLCIRWAKFWSFSFSINPSNEYSGLISFRIDKLDFPIVKGVSRILSSTTNWKHQFLSAQPSLWSNSHILTWLLEKS